MIRKASIDIGTNSTRLLITDIDSSDNFFPILTKERITRLGDGFDESLHLSKEAMQRVLTVLREYLHFCQYLAATDIVIFATSASRDAVNKDEFVGKIFQETGRECQILSGKEEATLSFFGVISDYSVDDNFLVCDIGGGSAEFIFGKGKHLIDRKSLDIGCRRMTRKFLHSDLIQASEISLMKNFIMETLEKELHNSPPVSACIGVGGTVTTLAMMEKSIAISEPEKAHRIDLSYPHLLQIIDKLAAKTIRERQQIIGLHPERADVILAGALIVESIMNFYDLSKIATSLRDLLYGIFIENGTGNEQG